MFVIYLATCVVNGKVYIGQASDFRKRRWAHENRKDYDSFFQRAIRKYGRSNFFWQTIGTAKTKSEANNLERLWITLLLATDRGHGYNLTTGGDGSFGIRQSEETRKKRNDSLKKAFALGKKHASGYKWKKGGHSLESRMKISAALRAKPRKPKRSCTVVGCNKPYHAHNFCSAHFHRWKRHGDPLKGNPMGRKGPMKGTKYANRRSTRCVRGIIDTRGNAHQQYSFLLDSGKQG